MDPIWYIWMQIYCPYFVSLLKGVLSSSKNIKKSRKPIISKFDHKSEEIENLVDMKVKGWFRIFFLFICINETCKIFTDLKQSRFSLFKSYMSLVFSVWVWPSGTSLDFEVFQVQNWKNGQNRARDSMDWPAS